MKVSYLRGTVSFDFYALIEHMSAEEKRDLIDTLSCDDQIIEDVTAQLLDGWTELGNHGGKMSGEINPYTPLDKARREIALRAGEVAKAEIEDLIRALRASKAREDEHSKWGWKLYAILDALKKMDTYKGEMPGIPSSPIWEDMEHFQIIRKEPHG